MPRDLAAISDDEFRRLLQDFEQDDVELKGHLSLENDGAEADFVRLVAGMSNSGGGSVCIGPYEQRPQ